jgi:hypothetical protein
MAVNRAFPCDELDTLARTSFRADHRDLRGALLARSREKVIQGRTTSAAGTKVRRRNLGLVA